MYIRNPGKILVKNLSKLIHNLEISNEKKARKGPIKMNVFFSTICSLNLFVIFIILNKLNLLIC